MDFSAFRLLLLKLSWHSIIKDFIKSNPAFYYNLIPIIKKLFINLSNYRDEEVDESRRERPKYASDIKDYTLGRIHHINNLVDIEFNLLFFKVVT